MNLTHSNYYSLEADLAFMSNSQFGSWIKCAAKTKATLDGKWVDPPKDAFIMGSYFDKALLTPDELPAEIEANYELYYTTRKTARAFVKQADDMVDRCKRDPFFMSIIQGEAQRIITWEMFGVKWKAMLDVTNHSESRFVDVKTVGQGIDDLKWDDELETRVPFYEQYRYWRQFTVYREAYRAEFGKYPKTAYIAACTKQDPPDIRVIELNNKRRFKRELETIEKALPRIMQMKYGEIPATRCEECDYCRSTRVLTGPEKATSETANDISWDELLT